MTRIDYKVGCFLTVSPYPFSYFALCNSGVIAHWQLSPTFELVSFSKIDMNETLKKEKNANFADFGDTRRCYTALAFASKVIVLCRVGSI